MSVPWLPITRWQGMTREMVREAGVDAHRDLLSARSPSRFDHALRSPVAQRARPDAVGNALDTGQGTRREESKEGGSRERRLQAKLQSEDIIAWSGLRLPERAGRLSESFAHGRIEPPNAPESRLKRDPGERELGLEDELVREVEPSRDKNFARARAQVLLEEAPELPAADAHAGGQGFRGRGDASSSEDLERSGKVAPPFPSIVSSRVRSGRHRLLVVSFQVRCSFSGLIGVGSMRRSALVMMTDSKWFVNHLGDALHDAVDPRTA